MNGLLHFVKQPINRYDEFIRRVNESIFFFVVFFSEENCIWLPCFFVWISLFLATTWFSLDTSGETISWIT